MPLVQADLSFKHSQMALAPFPFFRASYYRWARRWPKVCEKEANAPSVLAVGDLHIENFGTWRDLEGRLVWGINDFDETIELPYTNDLVRLVTSGAIAERESRLSITLDRAAELLLEGYEKALETNGGPMVLEEHHPELRRMATGSLRAPDQFWDKMTALPEASGPLADESKVVIGDLMPAAESVSVRARRAGLGSLGRPRFVLIGAFEGGLLAREAKRLTGSAVLYAAGVRPPYSTRYGEVLDRAVRCNDPHVHVRGDWLVRRLAPLCSRISMEEWPKEREEQHLIRAMGFETANVHLGTPEARDAIAKDLAGRSKRWLQKAAIAMAEDVGRDFEDWRAHQK